MTITIAGWPSRWRFRRRRPKHCAPRRRRAALPAPRHATCRTVGPPASAVPAARPEPESWLAAPVTSLDLFAYQPPRYVRDEAVRESCEALVAARRMAGMLP